MAGKVEWDVGEPLVLWTKADSQAVAEEMRRRIIVRTAEGVGADGKPLAPYARGRRKGQTATLRKTGKMLDGMAARGTPKRAAVRTTVPYARVQDRLRSWFGLTDEEWRELGEDFIAELVQAHVTESLPKEPTHG